MIELRTPFLPSMELDVCSISASFFNTVLQGFSGLAEQDDVEEDIADGSAMPSKLQKLLERVVAEGASDLHLAARRKPHWRIDGVMTPIQDAAKLSGQETYDLLRPLMQQRSIDAFENHNEVDFAISLGNYARFRVNLFQGKWRSQCGSSIDSESNIDCWSVGFAPRCIRVGTAAQGFGIGNGSNWFRKVDDIGGNGRLLESQSAVAHHDLRRPN